MRRPSWLAALVVGLAFGVVGGVIVEQSYPDVIPVLAPNASRGSLDRRALDQALAIIRVDYYNRNVDYTKLSEGSVRGLVQSLNDPFTIYLDPQQYRAQQKSYSNQYSGVGIYLRFPGGYPVITGVVPGSPAAHAGVQAGDTIVAVDGADVKNITQDSLSRRIQGASGTSVTLTVDRGGSRLMFTLKRAQITVPFVRSKTFGSVLYIRISSFGTDTTKQFDDVLRQHVSAAHALVLDLRGNPGGFVTSATDVISDFVDSGEAFEVRDRDGHVTKTMVGGTHLAPNVPLYVLVDHDSASAAEIVSGSLMAHHRARLIGTVTYGKGSVQEDFPLYDGSDIHLTIQHWFLPGGHSVDKVGLKPDVAVNLANPNDMYSVDSSGSSPDRDTQLQRALQLAGT